MAMRLKMRKTLFCSFAVVLLNLSNVLAQPVQKYPLSPGDEKQTLPSLQGLDVPEPPAWTSDGKPLEPTNEIEAPRGPCLGYLANAPIANIDQLNRRERHRKRLHCRAYPR